MNEMEILNVHSETVLSEIMNLNSECQRLLASFHKCNKLLFSILTQLKNEGRTQQPSKIFFILN